MMTLFSLVPYFVAFCVCAYLALASRYVEHRRKQHWSGILKDCAGALLPSANTTVAEGAASTAPDTDLIAVFSVMQSGTPGVVQRYSRASDVQALFGGGEGLEFCAHYFAMTKKPVLFGSMPIVSAAAITNVDVSHVTGTSVLTFTGTPLDDEEIQFRIQNDGANGTGGTVGTAGLIAQYSRDRGRTWSGNIPLGTATSYLIPNTGVTVNFAAGSLKTGDYASCFCTSPKWDTTGLNACITALINRTENPRAIMVIGDCVDATHLNNVVTAAQNYYAANRFAHVFCNLNDNYAPAVAQYAGVQTVTTNSAGKTYTRSAGSYITDGFQVGMTTTFGGFVNAANNGPKTIVTVTATVITVLEAVGATETTVANTTASAVESDIKWQQRVGVFAGATPSTLINEQKVVAGMGRGRRPSPTIDGFTKRRPASWWALAEWMLNDVQISPADVSVAGAIPNVTITDLNGNPEDHDERTMGGVLAYRMTCLRTFSERNLSGVYVALGVTLDTDQAPLSRVQVGGVCHLAAAIAQAETAKRLNANVLLNNDGTIQEGDAQRIESEVTSALKAELITRKRQGQRASSVTFQMQRGIDLTVPGQTVPTLTTIVPLGYLEQIVNKVLVAKAS